MSQLDDKTIAAYFDEVNALLQKTTLTKAERKKAEALVSVLILNPSMANYISQNSDLCSHIQKLADVAVSASHKQYLKKVPMEVFVGDSDSMNTIANSRAAMVLVSSSEIAMRLIANSEIAMNEIVNSETAMNEIAKSEVALREISLVESAVNSICTSQVAAAAIGNSTAFSALGNLCNPAETAVTEEYIAKLLVTASGEDPSTITQLEDFWNNTAARQYMWQHPGTSYLFGRWLGNFSWDGDTAPLDDDAVAGLITKVEWGAPPYVATNDGTWHTQIEEKDGYYISFIKYHSVYASDWVDGCISNYDLTDQTCFGGGYNQTVFGKKFTTNGVCIRFYDADQANNRDGSYAISYYKKVE